MTNWGKAGDDEIWGGDQDDLIRGGLGNETRTGAHFLGTQGKDSFVLAPGEGRDRILDFECDRRFL